ncbi:hypothetical protein LPJ66_011737, partial [Kickxella alabastrina]
GNAGAAQQPAAQTQGQLWQGTLVWESKQGENQRHEPSCLIVATGHPGISYSALELKLSDWPEKMRVSQIVNASEQFAEYCIQSKIQIVQIGAHANATAEQTKYFDDFCTTLREKSVYALVRIGPSSATLPWNGIFFTYYRGNLVALPFMNRPITTAVIAALSRCTLNNAAGPAPATIFNSNAAPALNGPQVGATSSSGGSVQITPQQSSLGLPMSAAANASILARSNSAGGGGPVTPVPASAVAQQQQQQIMSPMQQFAAQPVTGSPSTSNATPNQIHMVLNFLQSHLSHEQMETIRAMPPSKRDVLVTRLFDEIRAKQRVSQQQAQQGQQGQPQQQQQQPQPQQQPQAQQQPQQQQQAQQQQQLQQMAIQQQIQNFQAQQQQLQFQQTSQQPLAQLVANHQHQQNQNQISQQSLNNIAALNSAMLSSAGQQSSIAAFAAQPQNYQQLILS